MQKGRYVDIFVEPDSNSKDGYQFSMKEGGVGTSNLVFNKNSDNMKKSDEYRIEFKLHNTKGAKLCFSKDTNMVFWAMEIPGPTEACPPPQSTFPGLYVDPGSPIEDSVLKVINTDLSVAQFAFALNFIEEGQKDGPTTKYICYDPIGSNQNGGTSGSRRSALYIAAGAAVVVGAAALYSCGAFRS
jgi:hypothetical protein